MSHPTAPDFKHLHGVERWAWLFAALLIGGAMGLSGPRGQLGATLGSCLMLANLWLMRRLGLRLYRALTARPSVVAALLLLHVKLLLLVAVIYVCIRYLPIDPLAFILGVSILPAAIVARAVQYGLSQSPEPPEAARAPAENGEN